MNVTAARACMEGKSNFVIRMLLSRYFDRVFKSYCPRYRTEFTLQVYILSIITQLILSHVRFNCEHLHAVTFLINKRC